MFIVLIFLIILVFAVIILFAFPQFSPIPYFPSNQKDLKLIVKALDLKNKQTVMDLGAGDGTVIFAAAKEAYKKNFDTKFIAVDINPILILIMNIRRLFFANRRNIKIIHGDMFKINLKSQVSNLVIYLYISPWFLEKIIKNWKPALSEVEGLEIVSYMYPIKSLKKKEIMLKGNKHNLYIYNIDKSYSL